MLVRQLRDDLRKQIMKSLKNTFACSVPAESWHVGVRITVCTNQLLFLTDNQPINSDEPSFLAACNQPPMCYYGDLRNMLPSSLVVCHCPEILNLEESKAENVKTLKIGY